MFHRGSAPDRRGVYGDPCYRGNISFFAFANTRTAPVESAATLAAQVVLGYSPAIRAGANCDFVICDTARSRQLQCGSGFLIWTKAT